MLKTKTHNNPEFRQNPITGRWVIIAAGRAKRPGDFTERHAEREVRGESDPFAEGHEKENPGELFAIRRKNTAKDTPGWLVRVIPNRYPIVSEHESIALKEQNGGLFRRRGAYGHHEVVVSVWHNTPFVRMTQQQGDHVVQALIARHKAHRRDPKVRYVLTFLNYGKGGGASVTHPHNQIVALPALTKEIAGEVAGSRRYFAKHGQCVYCAMLAAEAQAKVRLVYGNSDFVVLSPFYARFPFELRIVPRAHQMHFDHMTTRQRRSFADALKVAWAKTWNVLHNPPVNYIIHTAPVDDGNYDHYHWHVAFFPRLSILAGVEIGSGAYVNYMPPELAAQHLRGAAKTLKKS